MTKIKITLPENYKQFFTVDEMNGINEMRRNNFTEINENGVTISDFTSRPESEVLRITAEFCKHTNADYFSDSRLIDIDIYINVLSYDGETFRDECYYYSDYIMRLDGENFTRDIKTAKVKR